MITLKRYGGNPLFVGSPFKLTIETGQVLSGASTPKVHYLKPDGTEGFLSGTIETGTDQIYAEFSDTENDIPGEWRFWASVILSGDSVATIGRAIIVEIFTPGNA